MSWLADFAPQPSSRVPLTTTSFCTYFLPAAIAYYVTAILVQLPNTFPIRLALLPISIWLAFRAATSLDVTAGWLGSTPGYEFLGYGLCLTMFTCCMRVLEWGFIQKPLRRLPVEDLRPSGSSPDGAKDKSNGHTNGHANGHTKPQQVVEQSPTTAKAIWDAFDLLFNLRGYGWDWTKKWHFPTETRSTTSTPSFLASTLFSACKYYIIFDLCLTTIRVISPPGVSKPSSGGSIFDPSLPLVLQYIIPLIISLVGGITVCAVIQLAYDVFTILGIVVLQQRPVQWPPIADSPWLSTSLTLCWSKRWHQVFRSSFIGVGAKPLSWLVGRVGGVMGAFFWSGLLHDWGMWGMGHGTEFSHVGGFFLMMGVGCIMEALFKMATGVKVDGWVGWVWTMSWMVGWGIPMLDAWARRGLLASKFVPEEFMIGHLILATIDKVWK